MCREGCKLSQPMHSSGPISINRVVADLRSSLASVYVRNGAEMLSLISRKLRINDLIRGRNQNKASLLEYRAYFFDEECGTNWKKCNSERINEVARKKGKLKIPKRLIVENIQR